MDPKCVLIIIIIFLLFVEHWWTAVSKVAYKSKIEWKGHA